MDEIVILFVVFSIAIFYSFLIAISIATLYFSNYFLGGFGRPTGLLLVAALWVFVSIHVGRSK